MLQLANVSLRNETPEDSNFLVELYLSTREDEPGFAQMLPKERDALLRSQFELQRQSYRKNYPAAWFTIITANSKPAGRLYVATSQSEMRLVDLSLLPEYRGHGVGDQLLKNLQAEATRLNIPIRLHAMIGNHAIYFYQRLGFVECSRTGSHIKMEWRSNVAF